MRASMGAPAAARCSGQRAHGPWQRSSITGRWSCPRVGPLRAAPEEGLGQVTSSTTTTTEPPSAAAAESGDGGSKAAILARIAAAKKYKQGGDAQPAAGSGPQAPAAAPLPLVGPTKVDWSAVVGFLDDPVQVERSGGPAPSLPGGGYGGTAPQEDEAADAALRAEREARFMADTDSKDYMQMLMSAPRRQGTGSATRAADSLVAVLSEPGQGGGGGEGEGGLAPLSPDMRMEEFTAAKEARLRALGGEVITRDLNYNPGEGVVVRVSMPGAGMMAGPEAVAAAEKAAKEEAARLAREAAEAEERRLKEEEERRAAEMEAFLRSEGAEAGPGSEDGEAYQPKVTTWGVFPRPNNISEAYGGGRNIKPGQALETPQQRAEREKQYAAAIAAYKKKAGLDVDPEDEKKAMELYEEGMVLFRDGRLKPAYDKFEAALKLVPVKSKPGGLATLQKAIILDSSNQSDAAQKLYKSIANHAVGQVAKKAKQMLFGFEAMAFMKADQFDYSVKKQDYDKYFRMPVDRRTVYVATEEEKAADERNAQVASLVAVVVILGPVLAVAGLVLGLGR